MKNCYKIKQKVSEKSYLMYPFEGVTRMVAYLDNEPEMLVEDMDDRYKDCVYMYRAIPADDGYYHGQVVATGDTDDVLELKDFQWKEMQAGHRVLMGVSSKSNNATLGLVGMGHI